MSQAEDPVFSIEKVYVKDISVEVPHAPHAFFQEEAAQVDVQMRTEGRGVGEGLFESTLTITVTASHGDQTAFLVEVGQAGLFQVRNVPEDELEPILGIACPNILFPYAREAISDAVTRAGFPPVLLAPVNFEAMYMSQRQAQEQGQGGESSIIVP